MKNFLTKTPVVITLALICCALWGSSFPCIKIGYRMFAIGENDTASQILFAGIRFLLAELMVIIICSFIYKRPLVPHNGTTIKQIFILSLFQTIMQYIFFYIGLANTTGSKAAIIEAANDFLAILVSGLLFKMEKVTSKKMLGCLIGFIGVVIIKYFSDKENPVLLSGWQFFVGGFVMILCGLAGGGHISGDSSPAILLLLYMAFISACAYTLWSLLLAHNPVSRIAVYGFSNPVFGVLLSALLLHETSVLNIRCLIALVLVCVGIILANKEKAK